jgi:hypothetical protein
MDPTQLPGLSVWLWGPTMWTILHTIASISDRTDTNVELMIQFFTNVQTILPCRYCRDSYGPILQDCIHEMADSFANIIQSKHLSLLMYAVHNKVNDKLAKQRWDEVKGVLKSRLPQHAHEALDCEDTERQLLTVLDKKPSILAVFKRDLVFSNEPVNLHAVNLLCILFSRRATIDRSQLKAFRIFLNTICIYFNAIENVSIKTWCKVLLQALRSDLDTVRDLEKIYFNFYPSTPKELEDKLTMFISSGCGAGTCK